MHMTMAVYMREGYIYIYTYIHVRSYDLCVCVCHTRLRCSKITSSVACRSLSASYSFFKAWKATRSAALLGQDAAAPIATPLCEVISESNDMISYYNVLSTNDECPTNIPQIPPKNNSTENVG